jgi:glycosyltransferase involved in cell wall biosynthesis
MISVIFTTFNEEHNIADAIDSVSWADEVIVVDSFSDDKTAEIAQHKGVKLLLRKYLGPADQKNWAIPQAKNQWVLLMDADERVTPELKTEIINILATKTTNENEAYWIGFKHNFMGKWVNYSGWRNDKTIRLINRDLCRYNNNQVHEEIITKNLKVGILKNRFLHYTYKDLDHFLNKMQRYASWSAEDYDKKTGRVTAYHLILKPMFRFFRHYVLKKGFLDGRVGICISAIMAWGVFLRYAKLIELRRKNIKY